MRDSGCNISYALRKSAIDQKRQSFVNASQNGFKVRVPAHVRVCVRVREWGGSRLRSYLSATFG